MVLEMCVHRVYALECAYLHVYAHVCVEDSDWPLDSLNHFSILLSETASN